MTLTDERIKAQWAVCQVGTASLPDKVCGLVRAIIAEHDAELRGQEPVGFGCFDLAGFLDQDLVGTEADCIFWRDSPDATNKWTVKALFTAPIPTPSQQEALDSLAGLLLGIELPKGKALAARQERACCLRDFILARPDTEGSGK